MIQFQGYYYDGRSAQAHTVAVSVEADGELLAIGDGIEARANANAMTTSDRLGATRRFITLPGGAAIETDDNDAVDAVAARFASGRGGQWIHAMERSWPIALAAVLVTAATIWGGLNYGVPVAAREVAHRLPIELETQLGEETLVALDKSLLEPTGLSDNEVGRVRKLFTLLAGAEAQVSLELRAAPKVGANAFALPSGVIVVTDELVELAENDDELLGVMAHEMGHVHHRHVLRSVLQNSATALIVAALVGDVSSIAGLSATLPTFLMEAKYSREFELEADRFAAQLMRAHQRDVASLSTMLRRLTDAAGASDDNSVLRYLSSHPATEERIKALKHIGQQAD